MMGLSPSNHEKHQELSSPSTGEDGGGGEQLFSPLTPPSPARGEGDNRVIF
jgi:hypothetical protein